MKVRYDSDSDILYLLIKGVGGLLRIPVEVSEDLFVDYDEKRDIVAIVFRKI